MDRNDNETSAISNLHFASVAEFAEVLLDTLHKATRRPPGDQVDLGSALDAAGVKAERAIMRDALLLLYRQGRISHLVPRSNGGLLLSVTDLPVTATGAEKEQCQ